MELLTFDVAGMPADSPTGYFVECDLRYPAELHALHNAYPIAPEHMYILEEMLSDTVRLMQDVTGVAHSPCTKLVSNLRDKTQTIIVCSSMSPTDSYWTRFTASLHSLSARTCCHLSNFVTTDGKTRSPKIKSSLYKLIANTFYGKTVENVRKRANVRLIAYPAKFVCSILKASYKRLSIFNTDLAMVENFRAKAVLSKPIAVRCAILEFVKLVMYEFYYDCLLPTFGDRLRVCFTDTDSFVCHVESNDLVGELGAIADLSLIHI